MADAIVSIVVERLADIIQKQFHEELSLVTGVKKEVLYLSSELKTIQNELDDAERKGYMEKSILSWLKKLEETSYDIDDVLDEWNFARLKLRIEGPDNVVPKPKVCPFLPSSCLCFKKVATRRDIAKKIKGLKERLDIIVKEKERYNFIVSEPNDRPRESNRVKSISLVDVSEIHGREADKDVLVSKLILDLEGLGQDELGPQVISVVGAGGIGKTTLAQLIYNDDRVANYFDLRIWICVSDVFEEVRIAKGIVEIVKGSTPNLNELEALLKCVRDSVSGKKFLLVLDDVWTEDYTKWEPFKKSLKCGGQGSKILVTTRSERVTRMMGSTEIHRLGQLSDTHCWLLMRLIAFSGRSEQECEEVQVIGRNIANKCKGLPLAAKVLGSLLRFKHTVEEWKNVLDNEIWQMEEAEVELFPHLFLSYNELSPSMKRCFSYCAVFPKDSEIDIEKLIKMWMSLGYLSSSQSASDLELRGKEYFDNLRMRSLFQNFEQYNNRATCKMHDIVHDFAQFLRKNKSHDLKDSYREVEARTKGSSQACDPSLVSHIKLYRTLFCHEEHPFSDLFNCTSSSRVLSLYQCELEEIPTEIENLIHLRYLDLSGNKFQRHIPQTICKLYNLQSLYLSGCWLKEIPREIGNLIALRHLDLSWNSYIKELPETIYNLHELRTLNLYHCSSLELLPEGIDRLANLRHILNDEANELKRIPQGLEQLTGLRTLRVFYAGRDWSKLGYLNNMDQLSGNLELNISLDNAEDVIEARKAKLRTKTDIQWLVLWFIDTMGRTDEEESIRNDFMEALQPSQNLRHLTIHDYKGTHFPGWISSLNHLRVLELQYSDHCSALPPLGKLLYLEEFTVEEMSGLEFLGREFLGIDVPLPSSGVVIAFPKLKELKILNCPNWKEWEDITAEEGDDAAMLVMPCLKKLKIVDCGLAVLPHRLLRKASSLQQLKILLSGRLVERYENQEGSDWDSLSHIPYVELK
ncbi:hypothetical protein BUALT_Bualt14G0046300 [Buddleja alternifolia]|uniref:Uncharacterized protein n=1 Tax=Buddleja alternifolia TaxID=168488 RepID=A0AAV6WNY8_9LAMI|nr:hypothetical protein BUALT_Bualt14G0046300 [Buddleja alternifolia]